MADCQKEKGLCSSKQKWVTDLERDNKVQLQPPKKQETKRRLKGDRSASSFHVWKIQLGVTSSVLTLLPAAIKHSSWKWYFCSLPTLSFNYCFLVLLSNMPQRRTFLGQSLVPVQIKDFSCSPEICTATVVLSGCRQGVKRQYIWIEPNKL